MWCGSGRGWLDLQIHEICRRSQAPKSWAHNCNYLLLDGSCHADIFATMPLARQLAVKKIRDPGNYSLEEWLKIRKTGEVTEADVEKEIPQLLDFFKMTCNLKKSKGLAF